MKYNEMVKKIADGNKTRFERGEVIIKEMNKLSTDILDYKYAAEHCSDDYGTVVEDRKNHIKNSIIVLKSDLDVYIEQLGLTEVIDKKATERLDRLAKKM